MKQKEAELQAIKLTEIAGVTAYVVRILPAHIDPIQFGDNGWDVEVTFTEVSDETDIT